MADRLSAADLTSDERLARRYASSNEALAKMKAQGKTEAVDVVVGAERPDLLMPHELFRHLVLLTIENPDGKFRAHFREEFLKAAQAANIDLGPSFFDDATSLSADYVRARKDAAQAPQAHWQEVCASAHRAFVELHRAYGRRLLQFLYVAVAPDVNVTSSYTAQDYKAAEEGCP